MKVALTVNDFLRRAELLYPDRIGDRRRARSARRVLGHARPTARWPSGPRAIAAGLDALGIGVGERVAMVSHNSARLLTALFGVCGSGRILVPINFRLVAEEVQLHRRALRRPRAAGRSRAGRGAGRRRVRAQVRDRRRRRRRAVALRRRAAAVGGRRGRHGDDQLHERHHGPAEGRAADPPQHLAQRHDVRLAPRHQRPRRLPAHAAAVPLQRVGHALRGHRHGRRARDHPQDRRRRDPAPRRAARRHADVRRAGRRQHGPRRRRDVGRRDPRPRPGAHRRRRRPAADAHDRAGRDRARAGSSSRSTGSPRRRRCSRSTAPAPSSTTSPPASGPSSSAAPAPRRSAARWTSTTRARCSPAATS